MPLHTLSHTFIVPYHYSLLTPKHFNSASSKRFVLHLAHSRLSLRPEPNSTVVAKGVNGLHPQNDDVFERPCEVYVCNIPRSFNAADLLYMFKPYGTILSVQVCRNAETGESNGCGYVTMRSIYSARNAVAALDGSDVGGREMRVRFSVEMNAKWRNSKRMKSSTTRSFFYEAPHKLYVGNLIKTVKPEQLRNLFSRFGDIVSVSVLHDFKQGKGRVFAFLSFQSEAERDAAISLDGTEFHGRTLVVKEGVENTVSTL